MTYWVSWPTVVSNSAETDHELYQMLCRFSDEELETASVFHDGRTEAASEVLKQLVTLYGEG